MAHMIVLTLESKSAKKHKPIIKTDYPVKIKKIYI